MTDHPDIRIGDRDRLRVQDLLRDAYGQGALDTDELEERLELALRARTQSDLVPLTADLPVPLDESLLPAPPPTAAPAEEKDEWDWSGEKDEKDGDGGWWGWIVLILIIAVAFGVGDRLVGGLGNADAITVFGSRTLTVTPEDADIGVITIFGSLEVTVTDEVVAHNNITSIFGSSECDTACTTNGAGEDPTRVTVTGLTLFGSVEFSR